MLKQLEELKQKAGQELEAVANVKELEAWRVRYLGKKSQLTRILRSLATLPLEERKQVGAFANEVKAKLEDSLEQKRRLLGEARLVTTIKEEQIDVTLPGRPFPRGRLHPITQTLQEICDIFVSMGFQVVEEPEVEWNYYNFEALNIPRHHPARDSMATLWVDATHTPMFYQIDGLAVDKGITMAELKGTLYEFARRFFGADRKVRFRCDYFPFVEPGVEMAIECLVCGGAGCRLCGNSGWIEILGAGMTHPLVLRRANLDPEIFTSFAFGMGIDRLPMLRYGIDDTRLFYTSDLRFLRQF